MAAASLALLASARSAEAVILYSNYDPSDTAVTEKQHFLPLDYRTPDASQSFGAAATVGAFCGNLFCTTLRSDAVTTEFVAPTSFLASNIITPLSIISSFGNFRIGYSIARLDTATNAWVGLGYMQVESGLLPFGPTLEVDVPFGESGARFIDYAYKPIQFDAGERYRIMASGWAGAVGGINWYLSDEAATAGQSVQYIAGAPSNLAFQPAFAFTDGGSLEVAAVPEPASWAMMIGGFALAGAAARRRAKQVNFA